MNRRECAIALGVVFYRPPFGDLDLAPGTMHVDDDEEIDGAVAAVLVLFAFALAPRRLAIPAPLPPELEPALVQSAHQRRGSRRLLLHGEHTLRSESLIPPR